MSVKVQLKCPHCNNRLKTTYSPRIENGALRCPSCSSVVRYTDCQILGYVNDYGQPVTKEGDPIIPTTGGNDVPKPYAIPGEVIRIRCRCSQVLSFKYQTGHEFAIIECPTCHRSERAMDYERISGKTTLPPPTPVSHSIGVIRVLGTKQKFPLVHGENLIGKKAKSSTATIQIETPSRLVSREHIVIEVSEDGRGGYKYKLRLNKEMVNATYVNNNKDPLQFGKSVDIKIGTQIRLPDVTLVLELPDSDQTIYQG